MNISNQCLYDDILIPYIFHVKLSKFFCKLSNVKDKVYFEIKY